MSYRFRLTFFKSSPGLFNIDKESIEIPIGDDRQLTLEPRNSNTLLEATKFHIEGRGFINEDSAKDAGERLRLRLRVLNSILNLGIIVQGEDTTSSKLSDSIKASIKNETGAIVLDTIVGLGIFPDDDHYVEHIVSGRINVEPSDPYYIVNALSKVWNLEISLDQRGEDALDIISRATAEGSPRSRFLLTYLALERMIDRIPRKGRAKDLVESFQQRVLESNLTEGEKDSLRGALSNLHEQSFRNALMEFEGKINFAQEFMGKSTRKFLLECIEIRNRIAHNADLDPGIDLNQIVDNLRMFVLKTIWTFNKLPEVSVDIPASRVTIPEGGLSFRMK